MQKIRAGSKYGKVKEDPQEQFKSQPQYIRSGLSYEEKFASVRHQSINQQLFACEVLKQQGNTLFKQQLFDKSIEEYEQALSIFRYIKNKNKLKKVIFQDKDLTYVVYQGSNLQEKILINQMLLAIYLNLAASYLRLNLSSDALQICEEALKIDPKSTKALFRKAQALTISSEATIQNYKDAQNTLTIAQQIDPQDQEINISLSKINNYLTQNQNSNLDENNFESDDDDFAYELNPDAQVPEELQILGQIIEKKGQEILKLLQLQGKSDEVELLKEKLQNVMESKRKIEKIARLDFNKPTKMLKELAELHSIDIYDENFKNEFKKIQQGNLDEVRTWLAQNKNDMEEINLNALFGQTSPSLMVPPLQRHQKKYRRIPKNSKNIVINNNYYNQTINIDNKVINQYFDPKNSEFDGKMKQKFDKNEDKIVKSNCNSLLLIVLVSSFLIAFIVYCFSRK